MANSILGSGILLGVGSLIGVPIGISGGIFLAEFGRGGKLANTVRFTADVLNGVPSIVMGIAVYSLIVLPQKHFSALSGGVALGIMMIPTITRTTEEMLLMVPNAIREAALGLGVSELAVGVIDYAEDGIAGHHHRLHAGICARGRRDGATAVYGVRQSILECESQRADCGASSADFYLCDFAL